MDAETRAKERKTRGHPSAQVGQLGEKQRLFGQKRHDPSGLAKKNRCGLNSVIVAKRAVTEKPMPQRCKGKQGHSLTRRLSQIIRGDACHIRVWETIGTLLGNDGVDLNSTTVGVRLSND